tara:strand:- start:538 stop:1386 length:849 start_codon:yes stop_codon:yes gene_type:complete
MIRIKQNDLDLNIDLCIISTNESRPSKSLINIDEYKLFSKLDLSLNIINEYNNNIDKIDKMLLYDIINHLNIFTEYKENLFISFNTICINELENSNLILSINTKKKYTIKCFLAIFKNILTEININDYLVISYLDLFNYPTYELLIILSSFFYKIKIYFCKIIKQNLILCYKYKSCNCTHIYINQLLSKLKNNLNIRKFGLFIKNEDLKDINYYNSLIFNYYINIFNFIHFDFYLEEIELLYKNNQKKFGLLKYNHTCNHYLVNCNINSCLICKNCYEFFLI